MSITHCGPNLFPLQFLLLLYSDFQTDLLLYSWRQLKTAIIHSLWLAAYYIQERLTESETALIPKQPVWRGYVVRCSVWSRRSFKYLIGHVHWALPFGLSQQDGLSTAGWWGSEQTFCTSKAHECAFPLVPVDVIVLECPARLVWMPEPSSLSITAYLLQGCGGTGACPSITWTRLGVTFTRQTAPRVNKLWTDAINADKQGWSVASRSTEYLLWRHLKCSPSDIFAVRETPEKLQPVILKWKLISSVPFPALTPLTHLCFSRLFHPQSYQFCWRP